MNRFEITDGRYITGESYVVALQVRVAERLRGRAVARVRAPQRRQPRLLLVEVLEVCHNNWYWHGNGQHAK